MDKTQPHSIEEQLQHKETADMIVATSINALARSINRWARAKGFWNVPDEVRAMKLSVGTLQWLERLIKSQKLALITTETSEAVEAIRKPESESGLPGFSNEEEEAADQVIRILDYAAHYNLRIGEAIIAKMAKNEGRPYKHGKEF